MIEPAERSDAELMARVGAGDVEVLSELVERYRDSTVNDLTRVTGSRERGEDLAQETFVRLFRSAPTGKRLAPPRTSPPRATGSTEHIGGDARTRRPVRLPPELEELFERFLPGAPARAGPDRGSGRR